MLWRNLNPIYWGLNLHLKFLSSLIAALISGLVRLWKLMLCVRVCRQVLQLLVQSPATCRRPSSRRSVTELRWSSHQLSRVTRHQVAARQGVPASFTAPNTVARRRPFCRQADVYQRVCGLVRLHAVAEVGRAYGPCVVQGPRVHTAQEISSARANSIGGASVTCATIHLGLMECGSVTLRGGATREYCGVVVNICVMHVTCSGQLRTHTYCIWITSHWCYDTSVLAGYALLVCDWIAALFLYIFLCHLRCVLCVCVSCLYVVLIV